MTDESAKCTFLRNEPQYQLWVGMDSISPYYFFLLSKSHYFKGFCEENNNRTQIINLYLLLKTK